MVSRPLARLDGVEARFQGGPRRALLLERLDQNRHDADVVDRFGPLGVRAHELRQHVLDLLREEAQEPSLGSVRARRLLDPAVAHASERIN